MSMNFSLRPPHPPTEKAPPFWERPRSWKAPGIDESYAGRRGHFQSGSNPWIDAPLQAGCRVPTSLRWSFATFLHPRVALLFPRVRCFCPRVRFFGFASISLSFSSFIEREKKEEGTENGKAGIHGSAIKGVDTPVTDPRVRNRYTGFPWMLRGEKNQWQQRVRPDRVGDPRVIRGNACAPLSSLAMEGQDHGR